MDFETEVSSILIVSILNQGNISVVFDVTMKISFTKPFDSIFVKDIADKCSELQ